MRVYCDEHGIAHPETGKLIVAVRKSELGRLDALKQRGEANGLRGLQMVDGDGIRQFEPAARGLRAIFSPATGIVDYGQVADALAKDVTAGGGTILTSHRVTGLTRSHGRWRITAATSTVDARTVISCAGLQSDTLAAMTGAALEPRIVPFRGEYARLSGERAGMVRGLIYPVPDPAFPFLGVHFTRRVGGEVWVGPNAILALAKEGYRRTRINAAELASLLRWPGFYRMGARYWRMGLSELSLALNKGAFARELQRYVPAVQAKDLSPAGAGVRAQAVSRDGRLLDDFVFSEEEGILHVRNAPSPAATACLAIAEVIADRVDR